MDITAPRFTNEEAAREHLEALRWPDGPFCPHCGSFNATRLQGTKARPGTVQCNEKECRQQFTVTVGTVFERSKVALNKWLLCNHLLCASKKGMSAHQIGRMLGVTYKTAWFMCHRIREAMNQPAGPLGGSGGVVEADETWVGGSQKKRAFRKVAPKKIVFTLVERDGKARSFHVANVTAKTLRPLVKENVRRHGTYLMTDEAGYHTKTGREFWHRTVNHDRNEFVKLSKWHTNTAENFFSILKRGIIGVYHHVSEAHLHRYTAEFDFRYNTKTDTDELRANKALRGIYGKRLTYRRTGLLAA